MAVTHLCQNASASMPKSGMKPYSCISRGESVWSKSYIMARIGRFSMQYSSFARVFRFIHYTQFVSMCQFSP